MNDTPHSSTEMKHNTINKRAPSVTTHHPWKPHTSTNTENNTCIHYIINTTYLTILYCMFKENHGILNINLKDNITTPFRIKNYKKQYSEAIM
jgi:hypothetical protein